MNPSLCYLMANHKLFMFTLGVVYDVYANQQAIYGSTGYYQQVVSTTVSKPDLQLYLHLARVRSDLRSKRLV